MTGRHSWMLTTVIAVAALAIAIGGVAYGAIPGADGRIRGCYEADPAGAGGVLKDLYVVDERDSCPTGTQELMWNQTGPIGATGATGAPGAQGAPGTSGKTDIPRGVYRTDVRLARDTGEIYKLFGNENATATIDCRHDETAIGGGADLVPVRVPSGYFALSASYPVKQQRSWFVRYVQVNPLPGPIKQSFEPIVVIRVWAICARTLITAAPPMPPSTGVTFGPRP